MKHILHCLAAFVLCAACLLTFAACGGGEPSSSVPEKEPVSSAPVSSGKEESQVSSMRPGEKFASIADFVASKDFQDQLSALKQQAEDGGVTVDVFADNDQLVYLFTYGDLGTLDQETKQAMSDALASALDSQADTFVKVAVSLKEAAEVKDPVVVVTYTLQDGEVLCTQKYDARGPIRSETDKAPGAPASSAAADSANADGKYATVADFVASPSMQAELAQMESTMNGSGMSITVTGQNGRLIYTFVYSDLGDLTDEDKETLSSALEEGLEEQASTFESVAKSLKLAVEEKDPTVVVRYLLEDGEELYSREFFGD